MKFATSAVHAGQPPDPGTGAVSVPVYQTSTFAYEGPGAPREYDYARSGNPTRTALEECLAALEEGKHGLAFSSGLAAIATVLQLLRPGDHVVVSDDLYGGTYRLFERVFRPAGLEFTYADPTDPSAVGTAFTRRTRLVWIETPTNPLLRLSDIREIAQIAHAGGARLAVDNTFASPFFQRPLPLGADIVAHSTTKYIAGHSDLVGGALVTSQPDLHERLRFLQNAVGAVPGPNDVFLTLRGIKTLPLRMREHARNALEVARFLEPHPLVRRVIFPGLPSHPQHALARHQMSGFSGMVSFELSGGRPSAFTFLSALKLIVLAESLGGVESLVSHPATMTHASVPPEIREKKGIGEGLIRLSVGIEDVEDLIADLDQALAKAGSAI